MIRSRHVGYICLVALTIILVGCGAATSSESAAPSTPIASSAIDPRSAEPIQDVWALEPFAPLELGTYFIDPDGDLATPLRVVFEVAAEGWSQWLGGAKFADGGSACSASGCPSSPSHVAVSISTVKNLVTDGCRDHSWADPPVGPGIDDLASALAELAPFEVTSPPSDVTIYGYSGKHLAWIVPDLPIAGSGSDQYFSGCIDGNLKSWVAFIDAATPGDAFYGYTGPGYVEDLWILDVEGTRLLIAAEQSAGSPAGDVAERDAILESIVIER